MPSTKNKANEFVDVVFPTNKETRKIIVDAVMKEYNSEDKELFS
jgi:DNA-binding cell septation regulator SpoVG